MKQFLKDLPIYINSLATTMLLLNTNMDTENFIWFGVAAIGFLIYENTPTNNK